MDPRLAIGWPDDNMHVFHILGNESVRFRWREGGNGAQWSGWQQFPTAATQAGTQCAAIVAGHIGDLGDIHVFALTTDGRILPTFRKSDGTWMWYSQGTWEIPFMGSRIPSLAHSKPIWEEPCAAHTVAVGQAQGKLQLLALEQDGTLRVTTGAGDQWDPWQHNWNNAPKLQSLATWQPRGVAHVFGVGLHNNILYATYLNGTTWSIWLPSFLGAPKLKSVATGESNGRFYLFGVAPDGSLYWAYQDHQGSWNTNTMNRFDAPALDSISLGDNHGQLHLFGIASGGVLCLNYLEDNSNWSGWDPNPTTHPTKGWNDAPLLASVATAHSGGHLHVFAIGRDPQETLYLNYCGDQYWSGWKNTW